MKRCSGQKLKEYIRDEDFPKLLTWIIQNMFQHIFMMETKLIRKCKEWNKVSANIMVKNGTLNIYVLREKKPRTFIHVKQPMIQTMKK